MYCKDCLSFGVCRYASGSRLLEKEPCADFMDIDKWGKPPCKVGDILYEPTDRGTISEYEVTAVYVELFSIFVEWRISEDIVHGINSNEIGKTVFLTREEAKQALEEKAMKSKNQGYVCYAANEINKSVLDSIEVGDLVKVNDWIKPMRVKFVAENGFAMTQKNFGVTCYLIFPKNTSEEEVSPDFKLYVKKRKARQ